MSHRGSGGRGGSLQRNSSGRGGGNGGGGRGGGYSNSNNRNQQQAAPRFPARQQMPSVLALNDVLQAGVGLSLPAKISKHTVPSSLIDKLVQAAADLVAEATNPDEGRKNSKLIISVLQGIIIVVIDGATSGVCLTELHVNTLARAMHAMMFTETSQTALAAVTPNSAAGRRGRMRVDEDIRFHAILVLDALARVCPAQLLGSWSYLLPDTSDFERNAPSKNLFTVVLHDTHIHAQLAACNCISSLLGHAKKFCTFATRAPQAHNRRGGGAGSQAFTAQGTQIGVMLVNVHIGIYNVMNSLLGYKTMLGATFRMLQQAIITTPYRSLPDACEELHGILRSEELAAAIAQPSSHQGDAIACVRNLFLGSVSIPGVGDWLTSDSGRATMQSIFSIVESPGRVNDAHDHVYDCSLQCVYSMALLHADIVKSLYWSRLVECFLAGMNSTVENHRYAVLLGVYRISNKSENDGATTAATTATTAASLGEKEWRDLYTKVLIPGLGDNSARVRAQAVRSCSCVDDDFVVQLSQSERKSFVDRVLSLLKLKTEEAVITVARCAGSWAQRRLSLQSSFPAMVDALSLALQDHPTTMATMGLSNLLSTLSAHPPTPRHSNFILAPATCDRLLSFAMSTYEASAGSEFQDAAHAVMLLGSIARCMPTESAVLVQSSSALPQVQCIVNYITRALVHSEHRVRRSGCRAVADLILNPIDIAQHCVGPDNAPALLGFLSKVLEFDEYLLVKSDAAEAIGQVCTAGTTTSSPATTTYLTGLEVVLLQSLLKTVSSLNETTHYEEYKNADRVARVLCEAFMALAERTFPWHGHADVMELFSSDFALLAEMLDRLAGCGITEPNHIIKNLHLVLAGKY
eukprot:PhM_4_TR9106/c0_g1_i3/m.83614